jgi:hypothetical protein
MGRGYIAAIIALLVIACGTEPTNVIVSTQLPETAPSPVIPDIVITVAAKTAEAEIIIPTATPEPGHWSEGPGLNDRRSGHIAVKLNDGRILVAGGSHPIGLSRVPGGTILGFVGDQSGEGIATAEILDANQKEWSFVLPMSVARTNATATLLDDGAVLVAGGESDNGVPLDSAEIFDPETGRWQLTGSMASPHAVHTATLLPDGTVALIGGLQRVPGEEPGTPSTVEIFDPKTGEWSDGPELIASESSISQSRFMHDAILVGGTHILVVGGVSTDGVQYNSVQSVLLLDTQTMQWRFAEPSNSRRQSTRLALLPDGRILAAGGADQNPRSESWDPGNGTWTTSGAAEGIRQGHEIAVLNDGRVMALGGRSSFRTLNSVELYSVADDTWTEVPNMSERRLGSTAIVLDDGRVLVAGGAASLGRGEYETKRSVEIYSIP